MNIKDLPNDRLLEHFEDAVKDRNYNPSSKDYNQSGYTYYELYGEVYWRIINSPL